MNEMQLFKHEDFGEIGVITIGGREFFPATACAKILGYADPYDAIKRHTRGSVKHLVPTYNQHSAEVMQEKKFIPESDLYRLITHSQLPAAEKFERWVFETVLPSIRKHSYYSTRDELPMDKITEIIQQTAAAVMSEVIQQLVPAILTAQKPLKATRTTCRQFSRDSSIIGHLPPELRREVEEMICDADYTYMNIVQFLAENGITLSTMSVHRYAKRKSAQKDLGDKTTHMVLSTYARSLDTQHTAMNRKFDEFFYGNKDSYATSTTNEQLSILLSEFVKRPDFFEKFIGAFKVKS